MLLNKTLVIKGLVLGIPFLTFLAKSLYSTKSRSLQDLSRYTTTITDILDTGKDVGITVLTVIQSLKDKRLSPEETLELAELLAANKKSLDKVLTTLIKDLKDHAIEKTEDDNLNA